MKYKILLLVLVSCSYTYAQNIPVKGNLGVKTAPAPANDYGGLYAIIEVTSNSTAENLGMVPGDILLEVNEEKMDSIQKIVNLGKQFVAGNTATALVLRNAKTVKLKGAIKAKLPYIYSNHEIEILEIPFREGYVRAYLAHPKGEGPFPAVYFIQGYPCESINSHPYSPTLQLTSTFVDLGYAVFLIEKPGVGEYVNLEPCSEYSFDDEVENFANGLQFLSNQKLVNKDKIFLFGHSLGGNVVPLIADNSMVAGIIVYGTMVKAWQDYLLDMSLYSQTYLEDAHKVMAQIPILKSALRKLYDENLSHTELNKQEKELLTNWYSYTPDGSILNRKIDFWKNFNQHDYLHEWLKIKVPVLVMHGESDVYTKGLDSELIAHAINKKHPGKATFIKVDSTNQLFAKVPSRAKELQYINSRLSARLAMSTFNEDLPKLVGSWIKSEESKEITEQYQFNASLFPQSVTGMASMDVVAEDFNDDGYKDIVLATEFGPNHIFMYENGKWIEGNKMPQLKQYVLPHKGEDSEDIAVADFDQDGDLDLFFVTEDTENHELLYNDGNGQFTLAEIQIPKNGEANAVLVNDFNNDGWRDILIGIRGQNELYINLDGKGFKLEESQEIWPKNKDHTQDLIAIDIDNDKDIDIVEAIEKGGNNIYFNQNGKLVEMSEKLPLSEDIETRKIVINDFDQDGDTDLFYCNVGWNPEKNAQNQLLENDGKGNFTNISHILPVDTTTTLGAVFFDINKDGNIDFVTTNFLFDKKVKVFVSKIKEGNWYFEEHNELLPEIDLVGGSSILPLSVEGKEYLYFSNFRSEDILLQRK